MTGPAPSVARIRAAVRTALNDLDPGALVLAAVSGGRDSLALAHAVAFEAPKLAMQPAAVIIDHGLQAASSTTASQVQTVLQNMGLNPVVVERVHVDDSATNVQFKCSMNNNACEEFLTYNQVMEYIANLEEKKIMWKFKGIVEHKSPLNKSHPEYKLFVL